MLKTRKRHNDVICRVLISAVIFFSTSALYAQTSISGVVVDLKNDPLVGVNVIVKGSTIGSITDIDGKYTIEASGSESVITFSFIGYKTQEITVGQQRTISVILEEDLKNIEEVVVVGYGVQKKVTVTGSVSSVRGSQLKASPTTNLSNAIIGRMPGVIGFQRSDEPGGGGTTIRIRGTNTLGSKEPLIVIDGVPDRGGGFDRLNPSEIESLSVLKDAAAAIYGSRAANGVILITTKRGKEGKVTVMYENSFGFSQPTRLPKMCNSFEYATMMNEINPGSYSKEQLNKFLDGSDQWGYPNTNWYSETIKSISPMYRLDLGVNGGTDRIKYYANIAANGEDGIYKNSANRYDQYSIRLNLDLRINESLSFSYGNTSRLEERNYPAKSSFSIFSGLRRGKPIYPAYWPTGEPGPDIEYGDNPAVTSTDAAGFDKQKTYYIQNNLSVNIEIPSIKGLMLVGNAAYDKRFFYRKLFKKPVILYSWDGITKSKEGLTSAERWISDPQLMRESTEETSWMLNAVVNYERVFDSQTLGITAGIEGQQKQNEYLSAFRRYFLSDQITELNAGSMKDLTNNGASWQESRINYFGRVSYNYIERYLIEFVWRLDGSYRFPKGERYGFFPGLSAAWRISEEPFFKKHVKGVNYFKLRASASQTGNDALLNEAGQYDRSIQYLNTYGFHNTGYIFGNNEVSRLYQTRTPNPNITWEVGTTYNLGIDLKFMNNHITWESDIFYHKRSKMLISRNASLSEITGITLPRENLGQMQNMGFETLLTWENLIGELNYNLSLNMTYAENKILFWDETPGIPEYQRSTGKSVNSPLYYVADGIFHNQQEIEDYPHWPGAVPGDVRFKDVNGDNKIDANDKMRLMKNSEPRFVCGLNIGLHYKNVDFSALLQGAAFSQIYIQTWSGTIGNFLKDYYDKRWTPENVDANGPRTYERENQYWISNRNTYFLRSGDYIRLKNAEIGYTLSARLLKRWGVSSLRFYGNATNLITLDKLKVVDPETDNKDLTQYPQRRVVNFGFSLSF